MISEIQAINETEDYLMQLINNLGRMLHSVATCTKIRCLNVGPFGLDMALLNKHWSLQNIISNMDRTRTILSGRDLSIRDPNVTTSTGGLY